MISDSGRHAIKAVVILATQPDNQPMGAKAIAQEIRAPQNYLGKLLQQLAAAGILNSARGHGGGFSLARKANKITLLDVLDPLQHISDKPECFFGWKKCSDSNPCAFHEQWKPQRKRIAELLTDTTIDDILDGKIIE